MSKIERLDQHTINSIAAGEVIDRPASVVKELVDNALDAGAETIRVEIRAGGVREIRVRDDGTGMSPADAALSLESHTTSKLRHVEDLDNLTSMGFRGEALASIAAVSRLSLVTREIGSEAGVRLEVEGGQRVFEGPAGAPEGTMISVRDLFYNTPARYKFLKSDMAEAAQVQERLCQLALTRPDVSFLLEKDGRTVLHSPGNGELLSAIFAVFGADIASAVHPVEYEEPPIHIRGFMSKPDYSRNNRTRQVFIVNGRVIRSRILQAAVDEACTTYFMKGRHPVLVFHLNVPHAFVDVNVHPQKSEVRFWDDRKVFSAVFHAVKALLGDDRSDRAQETAETPANLQRSAPVQQTFDLTKAAPVPSGIIRDDRPQQTEPLPPSASAPSAPVDARRTDEPLTRPEPKDGERKIADLIGSKILGQYLNTYIVLQVGSRLVLIDQHAAHERILYERLLKHPLKAADAGRQPLLLPVEVEVTPAEAAYIDENLSALADMGFEAEPFGPGTYVLRSAPDLKQQVDVQQFFSELIAALSENGEREDRSFHDAFALKACKSAIKASQPMSVSEIEHLLEDLQSLDNPYHCPHGRPITVEFTKTEIEKRFGRIV